MYQSWPSPPTSQRMLLKMERSSAVLPKPRASTLAGKGLAQLGMAWAPPRSLGRISRGSASTPSSPSHRLPFESTTSAPPMLILSGISNSCAEAGTNVSRQTGNTSETIARWRICILPGSTGMFIMLERKTETVPTPQTRRSARLVSDPFHCTDKKRGGSIKSWGFTGPGRYRPMAWSP